MVDAKIENPFETMQNVIWQASFRAGVNLMRSTTMTEDGDPFDIIAAARRAVDDTIKMVGVTPQTVVRASAERAVIPPELEGTFANWIANCDYLLPPVYAVLVITFFVAEAMRQVPELVQLEEAREADSERLARS